MGKKEDVNSYSRKEERLNVISHGFGLFLSVIGLILLIFRAFQFDDLSFRLSLIVFGLGLVILYSASTFYHNAKDASLRYRLKILDHIAIFILIAATYTPLALVTLNGTVGWIIFTVAWGIAVTGIILKLFFTGRYKTLSTIMYVGMGWIIIFAIKPLLENFPAEGLLWLLAGGIAYTIGAVMYSINRISYNHAWFHVFVLLGSIGHFVAIYSYVRP